MARCYSFRAVSALLALAALTTPAFAQNVGAGLSDSGSLPWVVVRVKYGDLSGKSDRILADYASREEALNVADALEKSREDLGIYYDVRKRKQGDSQHSHARLRRLGTGVTPQSQSPRAGLR